MPDVYTTTMCDHLADCYQARGLSPDGAVQVANQQAPSSVIDRAMYRAHTLTNPLGKKETPPGLPGLQTAPSQTNVVSLAP